jgi:hypothetical protein
VKNFYLFAAITGAVLPLFFFLQFFGAPAQAGFVASLFVNGATSGFTADLLISSFVFWAYMWTQDESAPKPWLFIVLNLAIGLSCALPAYLYVVAKRKG